MTALLQLLCPHKTMRITTDGSRLFVRCADCGHESPGISTGGHDYGMPEILEAANA